MGSGPPTLGLGNFPKQAQDALISLTRLEQAKQRELRADQQECLLTAGIDVAGPGEDETVLAIRQGNNIIEIRSFRQQDARGELVAALLPAFILGSSCCRVRGTLRRCSIDSRRLG